MANIQAMIPPQSCPTKQHLLYPLKENKYTQDHILIPQKTKLLIKNRTNSQLETLIAGFSPLSFLYPDLKPVKPTTVKINTSSTICPSKDIYTYTVDACIDTLYICVQPKKEIPPPPLTLWTSYLNKKLNERYARECCPVHTAAFSPDS